MSQITRDNHFVPQLYLKQWSEDGNRVWTYRLLVPHKNVREWELRSIRGVAFQRDLYTYIENGKELDEFERWIQANYETPVQESIQKVTRNKPLNSLDWERLVLFLAAQDVRTPTNYFESMKRWEKSLPKILEDALKKSIERLEQFQKENKGTDEPFLPVEPPSTRKLDVRPKVIVDKDQGVIQAEIVAGRRMWLEKQKFLLTNTSQALLAHKWSIVEPARGFEWFTTDHPVVRLNYYGQGSYDLKGGWGNIGTNLFMPLSPKHLLFTQIGDEYPDHFVLSTTQTKLLQRYLAERAFRQIFARKPQEKVRKYRPRHVDPIAIQEEETAWKEWHKEQSSVESLN